MERWQGKIAVVTGCSSGIGAAIAIELANSGLIVVGLARRVERIEQLKQRVAAAKQSNLHGYKCDVASLQSVNEAFDWIIEKFGAVDILINNAGIGRPGQLVKMEVSTIQEVLQTNVMGIVHCTQRAFKSMQQRQFNGHVVLINSVFGSKAMASFPPGTTPHLNIYPPSKFAVTAITEIYRQEFAGLGTKVKITSISPGLVETEIISPEKAVAMKDCILQPEDIAQAVLFAIATPPHVQIHEMIVKPLGELV